HDAIKAVGRIGPGSVERSVAQDREVDAVAALVLLDIVLGRLLAATIEAAFTAVDIDGAGIDEPGHASGAAGFQHVDRAQHVDLYGEQRLLRRLRENSDSRGDV